MPIWQQIHLGLRPGTVPVAHGLSRDQWQRLGVRLQAGEGAVATAIRGWLAHAAGGRR
jgi:hypothetical protein